MAAPATKAMLLGGGRGRLIEEARKIAEEEVEAEVAASLKKMQISQN